MHRIKALKIIVLAFAFALLAAPSQSAASPATSVDPTTPWGQFHFNAAGTDAEGCLFICDPLFLSSGNNAFQLGDPPWTFTGAGVLIVQDVFLRGDRFEIFDNDVSLGLTNDPVIDDNLAPGCGSDPAVCFFVAGSSHGIFELGDFAHSITIRVAQAPAFFGTPGGVAYLCVDSGRGECGVPLGDQQVSEPSSMLLLAVGFAGAFVWLKRPELCRILIRVLRKRGRR